jgi:drug/metabolite transporter (DMT)-like permease
VDDLPKLNYATPIQKARISRLAIMACAVAAISGPVGGIVSNSLEPTTPAIFWTARFLPDAIALVLAISAGDRIHQNRKKLRGHLFALLAIIITLFWVLCGFAAPM